MRRYVLALLVPLLGAFAGSAPAQDIAVSPNVTIDLGAGAVVSDEDVAIDDQSGAIVLEDLGTLPRESEVIALGLDVNGDRFIAFETATMLPDGTTARPGDVVRYDGVGYSIEFDALLAELPAGTATDATSLSKNGLLLSFDTTVDLGGGLIAADEDLVVWNGSTFVLLFDGLAAGIDPSLDVDAAQDIGGGKFLISLDSAGEIGGIAFDDEDVLRFDGTNWSLEFDASAANASWTGADLDAVMLPEPAVGTMLAIGVIWLCGVRHSS
jgi:hypothetical protein